MSPVPLDKSTLAKIQRLIEGNFSGRDELYAAAESLNDNDRKRICQCLAVHLANNAAHLQQIVAANGAEPVGPLDMDALATALFELVKNNRGESGVLDAAAEGERNLKKQYDRAIEATSEKETKEMLDQQRGDVEFGEQILRNIQNGE